MGKKGGWFSAIKRAFTHGTKDKSSNGSLDKTSSKEKRKGKGILSHGETKSFIPLFREPSSIEKILGEAEQLLIRPPTSPERPKTPPALLWRPSSPKAASPKATLHRATSPKAASPRVSSARITSPQASSPKAAVASTSAHAAASWKSAIPKVTQSQKDVRYVQRPELTLRNQHASATKIQAALRGYLARRNFRALRGLVRLQGVVRGQNVKRQTVNAMKQMQLLVRVQTQIQSQRIQMLESQALQNRNNKEVESSFSKWTGLNQLAEDGHNNEWDDSVLPKEEIDTRMRKKVEAIIKRERAMAYAYSHQLWKDNPKSAQSPLDIRSNGFPWWWNWLERQLLPATNSQGQSTSKSIVLTPPKPISGNKPSPQLNAGAYKNHNFTFDNHEAVAPLSSRSIPIRAKQFQTPTSTPPPDTVASGFTRHAKLRGSIASNSGYNNLPLRDDDSLTSCPPFSIPNYMNPTVSAKAKSRPNSNPKERLTGTPGNDSKRRFSFPLTPNIGPFKWNNKGPTTKDTAPQKALEKHRSMHSIGDLSIDSTVSMPAIVGRKPFNRFV